MQRAAMEQPVHVALGVVSDAQDAKEVALDVEQAAANARRQPAGRHDSGDHERKPDRPALGRHARQNSQARGDHHAQYAQYRVSQPRLVGRQNHRQAEHDSREEQVPQPVLPASSIRMGLEPWCDQTRQDQCQGILDNPVEDEGSDERVPDPAQEPAQGDGDVKHRQMPRRRPQLGQRTVASQANRRKTRSDEGESIKGERTRRS